MESVLDRRARTWSAERRISGRPRVALSSTPPIPAPSWRGSTSSPRCFLNSSRH